MERFAPTFMIQIEGEQLSQNITQRITRFVYEDCEDQDDLLDITLEGGLDLADDPLLQEGNLIKARWGYVDEWSDIKECVLKEPEYDFGNVVRVKLKAYDAGSKLKGKSSQKIWKNKTYSQIASEIADKYKLKAVVDDSKELVVSEPQGNKSDFTFLRHLADKIGYQFYIQADELHFHKRSLDKKPLLTLTYMGRDGLLLSFRPKVKAQSSKAEGTQTKVVGFDPMAKKAVVHEANDGNTNQTVLGKKTLLVDGATGEEKYESQETGKVIPTPHQSAQENQKLAEGVKKKAQLDQLEAEATVVGTIVEQIQELRQMTVGQLREKYEEVFGESTSARNKDYLWKKIAWRIQEMEYGGLSERAKRRAREIANEHDIRVRPPRGTFNEFNQASTSRGQKNNHLPAVGTILTKEYKGKTIDVEVLKKGFRFGEKVYRSLSAIAREVTGTHWNGWQFFGIKGSGK